MNNTTLIGRLARDPELNYTASNLAMATMTVAVDRGKDKNGEDRGADFIRVKAFGKTAENCDRYLAKGRQVGVRGRISTGSYEKDGIKHYTTDIIADEVQFLDKAEVRPAQNEFESVQESFKAVDDDMPF